MDIELLITAFFNRIRHPGEASLSTALKKRSPILVVHSRVRNQERVGKKNSGNLHVI
jgi:hypothetical protein